MTPPLTMQFSLTGGSGAVTVNKPLYDYDIEMHLPILSQINGDGSRTWFIASPTPYYILKPTRWLTTKTQATALAYFLRFVGRGSDIVFNCGHDTDSGDPWQSGFFPAGPLYGDKSDPTGNYFTGRILGSAPSAVLTKPMRWVQSELSFAMSTAHAAVSYGDPIPQGKLSIDVISQQLGSTTISNLPPPDESKPDPRYEVQTSTGRTGTASSLSGSPATDTFLGTITLTLWTANLAALLDAYLAAVAAASTYGDVSLAISDPGYGIFGPDVGYAGQWSCQLLGSGTDAGDEIVVTMRHVSWDRWQVTLGLLYRGAL